MTANPIKFPVEVSNVMSYHLKMTDHSPSSDHRFSIHRARPHAWIQLPEPLWACAKHFGSTVLNPLPRDGICMFLVKMDCRFHTPQKVFFVKRFKDIRREWDYLMPGHHIRFGSLAMSFVASCQHDLATQLACHANNTFYVEDSSLKLKCPSPL